MSYIEERSAYGPDDSYEAQSRGSAAWAGFVAFGGIMMLMLGGFQLTQGFVAIVRDDFYHVTRNGLLLTMDYTAWGWTLVVIGIVVCAAGIGVLAGQTWARAVGVVTAVLSALANLAFMPAYPFWSAIVIALDVLLIYALIVHGRDVRTH